MIDNKLMEAAADILSGSKSKAPTMSPEKLPGEVQDLGGPTPQNGKPTDDSEKIDTSKGSKDFSAQNKKEHDMHPSDASPKVVDKLKKEDVDQSDIDAIFEGGTISEEFKTKAATIFEARILEKTKQIEEDMETKYAGMLEESVQQIQEDLAKKVDDYLAYVIEQWMDENQVAIETGLRTELAEDFISGLKTLFVEHYIDVPEDKINVVDELSSRVVELEDKLNEEIDRNVAYRKELVESKKSEIMYIVSEGLTATQVEKLKTLAESVEFSTEDEYKTKLEIIRESYFAPGVKKGTEEQLHETFEEEQKVIINDPFVAAVSQAISKTNK